ncbi:MAG TPA: hemolysin, partial [Ruminococcaceae bacterium]|nr:hemolysin [Oscillospiraceae bacterium]
AAAGIAMKLCWFNAPRWLTTLLYLLMGWAILADMSIFSRMSAGAICLLVLGGVFYTVGGVIYGLKKPNLSSKLGFHELFHLFVLGGSLFHYLLVLLYIA